jgi:signal transduction histidine kinase
MITVLMTSQLAVIANRSRHVEKEVNARTEDLRQAKAQLESQIEERARLEAEMSELATRERQKLGRDLHDSLGQKLTGAVYLSRSLLQHLGAAQADEEKHARTLNETLKEAVSQVRGMARGLAPVTLNNESLADAVSELVAEMTDLYGVSCETIQPLDEIELDERTKEAVYLIAREAVNNACRHAQATRVTLSLHAQSTGLTMQIDDDGVGIPATMTTTKGMGLRIMHYRARMAGGDLHIRPLEKSGTRVELHVPCH